MFFDTIEFNYPFSPDFERALLSSFDYGQTSNFRHQRSSEKSDFIIDELTGECIEHEPSSISVMYETTGYKKFHTYKPSWLNEISICHNLIDKRLYFAFSLPKYLYGHNVNLFPDPAKVSNITETASALRGAVRYFFKKEMSHDVDFSHLDVTRLDICFNHRFDNADNLRDYKNCLYMNYQRAGGSFRIFGDNETFMQVLNNYSFKFYDKEKEWIAKQRPDYLKRLRLRYGIELADHYIKKIDEHAANILRAEISLRSRKIIDLIFTNSEIYNFNPSFKERLKSQKKAFDSVNSNISRLIRLRKALELGKPYASIYQNINFEQIKEIYTPESLLSVIYNVSDDFNERYILDRILNSESSKIWRGYKKLMRIKPIRLSYDEIPFKINRLGFLDTQSKKIHYQSRIGEPLYYVLDEHLLQILQNLFLKLTKGIIKPANNKSKLSLLEFVTLNGERIQKELECKPTVKTLQKFLVMLEKQGEALLKKSQKSTFNRNISEINKIKAHYNIETDTYKLNEYFDTSKMFVNLAVQKY